MNFFSLHIHFNLHIFDLLKLTVSDFFFKHLENRNIDGLNFCFIKFVYLYPWYFFVLRDTPYSWYRLIMVMMHGAFEEFSF